MVTPSVGLREMSGKNDHRVNLKIPGVLEKSHLKMKLTLEAMFPTFMYT